MPRASYLVPRTSSCGGFTLLEMMVIVFIISMVAIIVFPLLPSTDASNLRDSARRLSTVIRYLGDQAITTKSNYRMQLDMTDNTVIVKKIVDNEETAPEDPFFSRKVLAEGVSIEDVEVPRLGKTGEGVVEADFGVAGLGEFTVIHLKGEKGGHFTITAFPNGGKVTVEEGYQEMQQ
ncbi:MAG TPA: prepilin-type N-terminal cleavage/methylation domain-containing protein [Geobacteraceae bacterium]